jgi:hypothetical protein
VPGENENRHNISHHGIKEAQGHAMRTVHDLHAVGGPECPPGILGAPLNPDPHGRGDRASPYAAPSSHRPAGAPAEMKPPHTAKPHRYGADPGPRESDIVSPRRDPRK